MESFPSGPLDANNRQRTAKMKARINLTTRFALNIAFSILEIAYLASEFHR